MLTLPKVRKFRQDAEDYQLKGDIVTILSDIIRFPILVSHTVEGKVIKGVARSGGKLYDFRLDYSRSQPQFFTKIRS